MVWSSKSSSVKDLAPPASRSIRHRSKECCRFHSLSCARRYRPWRIPPICTRQYRSPKRSSDSDSATHSLKRSPTPFSSSGRSRLRQSHCSKRQRRTSSCTPKRGSTRPTRREAPLLLISGTADHTVTAAVVRDLRVVYAGRCASGGARRGAAAAVMMNRDKQSRSGSRGCHGI